ncbi:MAG: hypothetical protein ABTD50_23265 [Polyangiaceae bacterium]|jgi:hypothetical protein
MSPGPNVIVGTPCYGGVVTHVYVHSMLKLMAYAMARNIGLGLWTAARDSLVTRSRNAIVAGFLDSPDATHLMFIDGDTGFEPEHFGRLVAFDQDVVAGMYPVKNLDWSQAARRCTEGNVTIEELRESGLHFVGVPSPESEREERDGFVTAIYAGTGFMLIRRSAVERFISAYPETKYATTHTFPAAAVQSANQYNVFDCLIEPETRTFLSEDFAFCHRWRRLGGKVWLDTRSCLQHVGTYDFCGTPLVETSK